MPLVEGGAVRGHSIGEKDQLKEVGREARTQLVQPEVWSNLCNTPHWASIKPWA